MRSLAESNKRWQVTNQHTASLSELQRAVGCDGPDGDSPCLSGCRSVCWKAFLLGHGRASSSNWTGTLLELRSTYSSVRAHFMKYINHPEYLANVVTDPLTDDPDSPWHTLRQDRVLRAEILQDVQRLPDEPFHHQPAVQALFVDVLFIYCKLNPDVGGYRQGMHELLAPIVYVIEQDAINPIETASGGSIDLGMVQMLDAAFIEHDSFALFSRLMESAKAFYELGEGTSGGQSVIVDKSKHIHHVLLQSVDPSLSSHLRNIEVLPQIFLIRWIRLLFSREFPLPDTLRLWDTLFAVDPSLQLIDLVCTAMIIRIRWDLLEADYSNALQLMLRYPEPQAPHGPYTFIHDAVYLSHHLNCDGGSTLITKYTGRPPTPPNTSSRPSTASTLASGLRQDVRSARLPSSPRFLPQKKDVEALLQGAAKGVLERGEKLGINQAVRDAMDEIRRNVSEATTSMLDLSTESGPSAMILQAVAAMDRRNKHLALMLAETNASLRELAAAPIQDHQSHREALEIAIAKMQYVQVHLEDSTLSFPEEECMPSKPQQPRPTGEETTVPGALADTVAIMSISEGELESGITRPTVAIPSIDISALPNGHNDGADMYNHSVTTSPVSTFGELNRPTGPKATRSTLTQSSFSWMLDPDDSPHSHTAASKKASSRPQSSKSASHRKRLSADESTAFLFGEPSPDSGDPASGLGLRADIFGLQPMRKDSKKSRSEGEGRMVAYHA